MHCLMNTGGIPSGPPLVLTLSFLIARSTRTGLNTMLLSLVLHSVPLKGGIERLSGVNLLLKTACNNSAFPRDR